MMSRSKLFGAALLAGSLAFFAPTAHAEEGEAAGGDLKKKIQQKMEKILKLMRENEEALLKLSTGKSAKTKRVDVDVPPPDGAGNKGGASGATGTSGSEGASGKDAAKELEKLLETVSEKGGSIPSELKQLVEMIPL